MSDYFPIFNVEPEPAFDPERIESMGSKEKFWFRFPEDEESGPDWLFKYPRSNSGEHWAEKIAAEMAYVLEIPHAEVELATCKDVRGSIARSFLQSGQSLIHGNECISDVVSFYQDLDGRIPSYDVEKRHSQSQHTLRTILIAITCYGGKESEFAEYVLLDALIGNTDRHHENWAWTFDSLSHELKTLSPSFDHASSLGRELNDDRRKILLEQNRVGQYAERAPGAIYWFEEGSNGPAPLQLVRLAVGEYPAAFVPGLSKLTHENILDVVARIPEDWMTDLQRAFAVELLKYNLGQLREFTDG